jgi:predicted TPR repeat methyltransferase
MTGCPKAGRRRQQVLMPVALACLPRALRPPPPAPPRDDPSARLSRWRAAFPALDGLIASGAAPGAALRRLGLTLWSRGAAEAAAEALAEAALWAPDDAAIRLDLGFARRAAGATAAAAEAFEAATRLAPGDARAFLALGLVSRELKSAGQAEGALLRALALDPALDEAAYALGLVCFDARRYAEAATHWRGIVARGFRAPGLWLGLGQCQFFLGEFSAAVQSLVAHLETAPDDSAAARRLALVAFLDGAIRGGPEGGRAAYAARAGGAPIGDVAKTAVQLLAAYGYASTALDVARAFMADAADDPLHRHHLAALAGEAVARAPADYVEAYFDRFADAFDTQMFEVLHYCGPRKLSRLLAETGAPGGVTLDIGCGTGAAAPYLRPRATRLIGVDLSTKMLEKARARGLYDELIQADMVDCVAGESDAFDLIFAADALIYLGDLQPFLAAAARALKVGGALALTLETTAKAPYELTTSGRFAHAPKAVIAAAADLGFALRASRRAFLRLEAHRRLNAALIVLERRG